MKIKVFKPCGFCNGVNQAYIKSIEIINNNQNKKIVFLGPLIHNKEALNNIMKPNVSIIDLPYDELVNYLRNNHDSNTIYILSAHGHYKDIDYIIDKYNLEFIDLTCPIIKNIHNKLLKLDLNNKKVFYIGKESHIECEVCKKYINSNNLVIINKYEGIDFSKFKEKLVFINQSTINIDNLNNYLSINFPKLDFEIINNYCPFVRERLTQIDKAKENKFNFLIIVGDKTSSNANELYKYAQKIYGEKTLFVENEKDSTLNIIKMNTNKESKICCISSTSVQEETIKRIKNYLNDFR